MLFYNPASAWCWRNGGPPARNVFMRRFNRSRTFIEAFGMSLRVLRLRETQGEKCIYEFMIISHQREPTVIYFHS